MAGMARAMGATMTGPQNCPAKVNICDLRFLNISFATNPTINSKGAST